jgi:flagellar assembly protein FliH
MDGSASRFAPDLPQGATIGNVFGLGSCDGILYIEDFDAPAPEEAEQLAPPEPVPQDPVFSAADIEAAHAAGRREGMEAALADALLVQGQLQAASTQALADSLDAARAALERVAAHHADQASRAVLAILRAAIPATMAAHGKTEIEGVVQALLPGLRCEPDLRVRTHPDNADFVRETLIDMLGADGGVLSVSPAPSLAPGDIQILWEDGQARRDCASIYADIATALAPLDLPKLEDICHGKRV